MFVASEPLEAAGRKGLIITVTLMNLTWLTPIEQVPKHRLLGVTVDEQLKWQTHINNKLFAELFLEIFFFFQN